MTKWNKQKNITCPNDDPVHGHVTRPQWVNIMRLIFSESEDDVGYIFLGMDALMKPISLWQFFTHDSKLTRICCCSSILGHQSTTKLYSCDGSVVDITCAEFCKDHVNTIWFRAKGWKTASVKWVSEWFSLTAFCFCQVGITGVELKVKWVAMI